MLFLLMLACASQTPDTGPCAQPTVTWDSFGQSFLITHCQGCHASTSPQRYGAPEGISFDTQEQRLEGTMEPCRWSRFYFMPSNIQYLRVKSSN